WPTLLANWGPTDNVGLRCARLNARQATGKADAQWTSEAQARWRSTGRSLPDACDALFAALDAQGGLRADARWGRGGDGVDGRQPAVVRSAACGPPAAARALAETDPFLGRKPSASALTWRR